MAREGFSPRKVGATPERPNIIGTHGGKGVGKNLLFTAHLDTEAPTWNPDLDAYKYSAETLANPEWEKCWLEDGKLYGYPIANDRGPMSCFMIAAKALEEGRLRAGGQDVPDRLSRRDRARADRGASRRRLHGQGHRGPLPVPPRRRRP
jgi:acetylornithine deacetylase/succinyl-diaminopimelate desuccinylase-like protein